MQWPITWRMLRNPRLYCMLGLMAIVAVIAAGVQVGARDPDVIHKKYLRKFLFACVNGIVP